jgi:GNAT superfamily N-acetyltransferase
MSELFIEDRWISETIGTPCYRFESNGSVNPFELANAMREIAAKEQVFFYAKVRTNQLPVVSQLARAGFSIVDTSVSLKRLAIQRSDAVPSKVEVVQALPEHYLSLQDIAASCFRYSRFHQDVLFPDVAANLLKRKWIENYCTGQRGNMLYAAIFDGCPAGFLAVLSSPFKPTFAAIDLIGVSAAYQRRGVGRALISRFIDEWQPRVNSLIVGTQVTNHESLKLYADFGFRVVDSNYVLHAHARKGELFQ